MQSTLKDKTIFTRDNLEILRGIDGNTIDLIYLDPPFNKKKQFSASKGTSAEGAMFQDVFRAADVKQEWLGLIAGTHPKTAQYIRAVGGLGHRSNKNYLCYMAVRLIEMHRVLKDTGSLYLHCDHTMVHYLKILLDCLFGESNFRNELVWHYPSMSRTSSSFPQKHDIILRYTKTEHYVFNHNEILIPYKQSTLDRAKYGGAGFSQNKTQANYLTKQGKIPDSVWDIPHIKSKKESTGYPTQKPLKLLERILKASTNVGDVILDPFCGCATTCVAAEKLNRQWIGIDISTKTYDLALHRLEKEVLVTGADSSNSASVSSLARVIHRTDIPDRTDIEEDKT